MGWLSKLLRKRQASPVGIGMDEPIEVSPGKFVTLRDTCKNAVSPEEMDERLRVEGVSNPELAKTLETHFGWKGGRPGALPVVTQIEDAAPAENKDKR